MNCCRDLWSGPVYLNVNACISVFPLLYWKKLLLKWKIILMVFVVSYHFFFFPAPLQITVVLPVLPGFANWNWRKVGEILTCLKCYPSFHQLFVSNLLEGVKCPYVQAPVGFFPVLFADFSQSLNYFLSNLSYMYLPVNELVPVGVYWELTCLLQNQLFKQSHF